MVPERKRDGMVMGSFPHVPQAVRDEEHTVSCPVS